MFGNKGGVRYGGQVGLAPGSEKILINEGIKLIGAVKPFFAWPVLVGLFLLFHLLWPANIFVISFMALSGVGLAVWALKFSRHPTILEMFHGAATILVGTMLICYADVAGFDPIIQFISIVGIPMLCLTWSIRAIAKQHEKDQATGITSLFEQAGVGPATLKLKKPAGVGKAVRKVSGKVTLPLGKGGQQQTVEDLTKHVPNLEAAWGLPPGSVLVTPDDESAKLANLVVSDPRGLNTNGVWKGPSIPSGGSIANPLALGTWQDGETVEATIANTHYQIMGMTGAGKSVGAGWSAMAEMMTRKDCAILAADITKGWQTLGPLKDGLHRVEVTEQGAKDMIIDVSQSIKARTDHLASKGYHNWRPDCGLTYLVVWLEEAPDIIDALGTKGVAQWISNLKAARSAGISYVLSLQRSDWTQLPTIARGQLAHWCFGVNDIKDAKFGLSGAQQARGVHPENWGSRYPGKSVIDGPSVNPSKIAMPLRTWYWGEDDSVIAAHVAQYPAIDRAIDSVTLGAMARDNADGIPDAPPEPIAPVVIVPPDVPLNEAKAKLYDHIVNELESPFVYGPISQFVRDLGKDRTWGYKHLNEWVTEGLLSTRKNSEGARTWSVIRSDDPPTDPLTRARRFQTNGKQRAEEYGSFVDPDLKAEHLLPLFDQRDCYYCGDPIGLSDRQIDHKVPLARGGEHSLDNLCAACSYCNESKGAMTEEEFKNK